MKAQTNVKNTFVSRIICVKGTTEYFGNMLVACWANSDSFSTIAVFSNINYKGADIPCVGQKAETPV